MPGALKTEAIVLRSIRYGEADRVLHLYTQDRGRMGATAKGVRKTKSRLGGRLEPFFRVRLILHEGRSDLFTVTGAETVAGYPRLRQDARGLDGAGRACEAVARVFDDGDPHPGVFNLLANQLALIDADPARATRANALAFRLKLLLAAGFAPQLAGCASCGERQHLVGFSGAAGGVVCAAWGAGGRGRAGAPPARGALEPARPLPPPRPPRHRPRARRRPRRGAHRVHP